MNQNSSKAVFLDRDGVINLYRNDYVKSIDEFVLLPNSIQAISKLNKMGFKIIVITNQSIINRKIISLDTLNEIHNFLVDTVSQNDGKILKIYFCPHTPDEHCNCRKPDPGLLEQAISDFNIDIKQSWFVGDSESDMIAASSVGLNHIRLECNGDLLKAVNLIENGEKECKLLS